MVLCQVPYEHKRELGFLLLKLFRLRIQQDVRQNNRLKAEQKILYEWRVLKYYFYDSLTKYPH